MKKILSYISAANQIVFFLAANVVVILFLISLFDNYQGEPNKVEILQETTDSSTSKKVVYSKTLEHRLKDIFIFSVQAEVIDPDKSHSGDQVLRKPVAFGSGYYFRADQTVNVMFVIEDQTGKLLFETDRLVTKIEVINEVKEHPTDYLIHKNCYLTVDEDSNNDGFLGEDDEQTLYISDYNGSNLKKILTNVTELRLIDDERVVAVTGKKEYQQFYLLNTETEALQKLNTEI